jgi:hypothetical protein
MTCSRSLALVAVLLTLLVAPPVGATLLTHTFDERPPAVADGLAVANGMLTFHFSVGGSPSADATYGGFGPGSLVFVSDPSLVGSALGVLTLDFAFPTAVFGFGVAVNLSDLLPDAVSVELFDAGLGSLGTTTLDLDVLLPGGFAEGRFDHEGTPIARARIAFDGALFIEGDRFAVDNMTFQVPLPGGLALAGLGLALALACRRQRWGMARAGR